MTHDNLPPGVTNKMIEDQMNPDEPEIDELDDDTQDDAEDYLAEVIHALHGRTELEDIAKRFYTAGKPYQDCVERICEVILSSEFNKT